LGKNIDGIISSLKVPNYPAPVRLLDCPGSRKTVNAFAQELEWLQGADFSPKTPRRTVRSFFLIRERASSGLSIDEIPSS